MMEHEAQITQQLISFVLINWFQPVSAVQHANRQLSALLSALRTDPTKSTAQSEALQLRFTRQRRMAVTTDKGFKRGWEHSHKP